tara:strand:+ start:455 stop:667 length:213 start_codon:yes stop_codon:yes gene_type:complete
MENEHHIGISVGTIYTKTVFCAIVNWKQAAWRQARRDGLETITAGGRVYVHGLAFDRYLTDMAIKAETEQ